MTGANTAATTTTQVRTTPAIPAGRVATSRRASRTGRAVTGRAGVAGVPSGAGTGALVNDIAEAYRDSPGAPAVTAEHASRGLGHRLSRYAAPGPAPCYLSVPCAG